MPGDSPIEFISMRKLWSVARASNLQISRQEDLLDQTVKEKIHFGMHDRIV
jgi:hypothetical protein